MNIPAVPKMDPPPKGFPLPVPDIACYVPTGLWPVWPFLYSRYSLCKALQGFGIFNRNGLTFVLKNDEVAYFFNYLSPANIRA